VRSLKVSHRALGLGFKDPVDPEQRQRKTSVNERLLDLFHCGTSAAKAQEAPVVEAILQHRIAGEARRLKIVPVPNHPLELGRCHTSSAGLLERMGELMR
jgi:hypothetical protein